jgi:hypothetical protein
MSIENHGGMMMTKENSSFLLQRSLAIQPTETYGSKQKE